MITALIASMAIPFAGGDISNLAKSISEATDQPVVFEAGASEQAPPFEYRIDDLNELARSIEKATGYKRAPGAEHAFNHGRLGSWLFSPRGVSRTLNDAAWRRVTGKLPEGFLNEGNVTLKTGENEAFSISAFPANLLSKPLQVHWMLQSTPFKAWVEDLPTEDFLNHVAKALGGKFLQQQNRYFIDVDPVEIQRRGLATLSMVQKDPRYPRMSTRDRFEVELSRAGLAALGTAQMRQLMASQNARVRFEIPGSMRPAIYAYITSELDGSSTQGDDERQTLAMQFEYAGQTADRLQTQAQERRLADMLAQRRGRNSTSRLMRVDPRIWGIAEIDTRFRVTVELATVRDASGRQPSPVRLP